MAFYLTFTFPMAFSVFPISRDFPGILIVLIPFWSGMG